MSVLTELGGLYEPRNPNRGAGKQMASRRGHRGGSGGRGGNHGSKPGGGRNKLSGDERSEFRPCSQGPARIKQMSATQWDSRRESAKPRCTCSGHEVGLHRGAGTSSGRRNGRIRLKKQNFREDKLTAQHRHLENAGRNMGTGRRGEVTHAQTGEAAGARGTPFWGRMKRGIRVWEPRRVGSLGQRGDGVMPRQHGAL